MSIEQNKVLAHWVWEELWNTGDFASAAHFVDVDNYIEHDPGPGMPPTWEAVAQLVQMTRSALPDLRSTIGDLVAEDDRVACRWTLRGTQHGAYLGIPPTGKAITLTGMGVIRVAEGKIVEHWGVVDLLGLMQQLGVVPTPGQSPN